MYSCYENRKMRPVKTILRMRGGGDKGERWSKLN
jgi:hypothetical protein